ncbi:MAG: CAAX prenyl protease-related protein [Zoogloeaceae bacterium]|nr:CAAX prenyl protease-related protein [Zoogloeaceae bacterium]MCP5241772.1 CAAX prenyl protease-related protein [Zoogloeaceae bacterium]MCP5256176.1 CAAX prenyl protease-related protein [Zoogloeaceae bacterium]
MTSEAMNGTLFDGRPGLARSVPFALYMLFLGLRPLLEPLLPEGSARWLYAAQIGSVMLALALLWRHYHELAEGPVSIARNLLAAVICGVLVFVLWINLDLPLLSLGQPEAGAPLDVAGRLDWPWLVVRVFGAAAVVPVMEELFWRSFIMRWLQKADFRRISPAAVGLRALFVSSLVFGLEHSLWFAGLLAGLAYGWLYRRSGNLWWPILAHGLTNFILGLWVISSGNWQFW